MAAQYVKGMTFNNMNMMLPWLTKLIDGDRALLGQDWALRHRAQSRGNRGGAAVPLRAGASARTLTPFR